MYPYFFHMRCDIHGHKEPGQLGRTCAIQEHPGIHIDQTLQHDVPRIRPGHPMEGTRRAA